MSQTTIWRMRVMYWITKATNTPSEYVIRIAFPLQQWLHKRDSLLRHSYSKLPVADFRILFKMFIKNK